MTSDDFRAALAGLFGDGAKAGRDTMVVRAGDLHHIVGGYPGPDHRMPVCCDVMYAEMLDGADEVSRRPAEGRRRFARDRVPATASPGPLAVSR